MEWRTRIEVWATVGLVFLGLRMYNRHQDKQVLSPKLPLNVSEKIIINPNNHQLTVVSRGKTQTVFLPNRPSAVEITKTGGVRVLARQFGTEISPFLGEGYGVGGERFMIGADGLYWKRFDFGGGLGLGHQLSLFGSASYNFYHDLRITAGVTHSLEPFVGITIRI